MRNVRQPQISCINWLADLGMKKKALARLEAPDTEMRPFRAFDSLMRFLRTL